MDDIKQVAAQNIAKLRVDRKMTQLELAEALNYSDKAVSKWERGESLPDVVTLKRIADLFGVTVDYLITEHSEGENPPAAKARHNNHLIITLIAFFGVWLLGTCIFVFLGLFEKRLWFAFISCVPISVLVLLIFNSIWGRKSMNLYLISAFMWSLLLTVCLGISLFSAFRFWILFIIGVPAQIIIFLCFRIKGEGKTKKDGAVSPNNRRRIRKKKDGEADSADQSEVSENE